jgi:hypothetical protein
MSSRYVEILNEVHDLRPAAEYDMALAPPSTRLGLETRKTQAIRRTKELMEEYKQLIKDNSIYLFLQGNPENVSEFAAIAEEAADTIEINGRLWDTSVGAGWWNANDKRVGSLETVHRIQLLDEVRKVMVDLGLNEVQDPVVPHGIFVSSVDSCIDKVGELTLASSGPKFRLALLEQEAMVAALDIQWGGDTEQPVVFLVTNGTEAEAIALREVNQRVFVEDASKEVTDEEVKKKLKKIVKFVKSTK